jgi:hypothetical protein
MVDKFLEKIIILFALIIFAVSYRLLDYPANFSPLAAIALFSGFYFKDKRIIFLPLAILFVTDFFIGFYHLGVMSSVYFSFAAIALIGVRINKIKPGKIVGSALGSSLLFFIVTNFAVWFFASWYAHNISGLLACYIAAIPFFRNTLLGDMFFIGLVFGVYEVYRYYKARIVEKSLLIKNTQLISKTSQ